MPAPSASKGKLLHKAVTVPPVISMLPAESPPPPPMPAPSALSLELSHFASKEPSPPMDTDAPSGTSKPARLLPLASELTEPSASVMLAEAPGSIAKVQPLPSASPLASILTPASVTFAGVALDDGTAMRSTLVVASGVAMETAMGVSVKNWSTLPA